MVLQVPVGSLCRSWPVKFLINSSLPLFRFASAASRESPVQAANKQRQSDAYRAAALSVMHFEVIT